MNRWKKHLRSLGVFVFVGYRRFAEVLRDRWRALGFGEDEEGARIRAIWHEQSHENVPKPLPIPDGRTTLLIVVAIDANQRAERADLNPPGNGVELVRDERDQAIAIMTECADCLIHKHECSNVVLLLEAHSPPILQATHRTQTPVPVHEDIVYLRSANDPTERHCLVKEPKRWRPKGSFKHDMSSE